MNLKNSVLILSLAASVASGCSDDKDTPIAVPHPGEEVSFDANLGTDSRTIYGDEFADGSAFPVYWVNGDLIQVASPQCAAGANNAEYSVSVQGKNQNYANSLDKTGERGVQWGSETMASFFSVYPGSRNMTIEGNTARAEMYIDPAQLAGFHATATHRPGMFDMEVDMQYAIMYAQTPGVRAGERVNLRFIPYSTVIEFEVAIDDALAASDVVYVHNITLTAPEGTLIAGDFTLTFDPEGKTAPVVTATSGSNSIKLTTFRYSSSSSGGGNSIMLDDTNEMMQAKMFLIPNGATIDGNWSVTLHTSGGTYVKTLGDVVNGRLVPGQIHKIKLPVLHHA